MPYLPSFWLHVHREQPTSNIIFRIVFLRSEVLRDDLDRRCTALSVTGASPAILAHGKKLRLPIDMEKPADDGLKVPTTDKYKSMVAQRSKWICGILGLREVKEEKEKVKEHAILQVLSRLLAHCLSMAHQRFSVQCFVPDHVLRWPWHIINPNLALPSYVKSTA